jgi:hypothetical protein
LDALAEWQDERMSDSPSIETFTDATEKARMIDFEVRRRNVL